MRTIFVAIFFSLSSVFIWFFFIIFVSQLSEFYYFIFMLFFIFFYFFLFFVQHSRSPYTKTDYTNTCAQHYFHLFSYLFIRVSMSILCVCTSWYFFVAFFLFAFTFSHYYLSYIRANIYIVRMFIRLRCCWFCFLLLLQFILLYFLFHFMLMPLFLSCCFFCC